VLVEFEYIYFQTLQHTRRPKELFDALSAQPQLSLPGWLGDLKSPAHLDLRTDELAALPGSIAGLQGLR
jgi:hypothetical protein